MELVKKKRKKKSDLTQEKEKTLQINRRANHTSRRNSPCPYTLTKVYDFYINQMIIAFVSAEMELVLRGMSTVSQKNPTPSPHQKPIFKDFCLRR